MPNIRYCTPEPGSGSYRGWHLKTLKVFDSREAAEAAADRCGGEVFYCEYGGCYHIGGGGPSSLYPTTYRRGI